MGTITPILDSLLPQVHGRPNEVARAARRAAHGPLSALRPVDVELRAPPHGEDTAGTERGLNQSRTTAKAPGEADGQALSSGTQLGATGLAGAGQRSASLHLTQGGGTLARLLTMLINTAESRPKTTTPLSDGTGKPEPGLLAERLAEQMVTSGQFYEAHLAQWVRGQYPIARLFEEPQAQLGRISSEQPPDKEDKSNANNQHHKGLDLRMAKLVSRQLEALTTGVLLWRGAAWPGAEMDWTIHREAPSQRSESETDSNWITSLALQLPSIGRVEARLQLVGERLSVTTWVEPGAGRNLIASDLETLRQRLSAAGFTNPSVRLLDDMDSA